MIRFSQHELVSMLLDRIKSQGNWSEGTYNRADPTHFERGKAFFYLGDAPHGIDEETGYDEYAPELLEVEFYDCTWSVKFMFTFVRADSTEEKMVASFGRSMTPDEDGTWSQEASKDFFKHFKNALISEPWNDMVKRSMCEDQLDPAGGLTSHE